MIAVILIMMLAILACVSVYMYKWFMCFFSLFDNMKLKIRRIVSVILTVICAIFCSSLFSTGTLFIGHFIIFSLVLDLVNSIIKKISKREYKIWTFVYKSGILAIVLVSVYLIYGYFNIHDVQVTKYEFASKKVEEQIKVGVISDLHLGNTMNAPDLDKYLKDIEKEGIDALLLAGDLFDESTEKVDMEEAAKRFGQVKSTYGSFYVIGNHDPNKYWNDNAYTMGEMLDTLKKSGVHVLMDEAVELDKLVIAGKKDVSLGERKSTEEILSAVSKDKYILLMDHQPVDFAEKVKAGVDLQISGHTHAGQIWPAGLFIEIFNLAELLYGHENVEGMDAVVTSGIAGWGYEIRTGGHSEYLIITIKGK